MTLEDFFTLTEMKDGLTALFRVEELVAVMRRENDAVVKNVGDVTRQWTAVASTIASTDSKECLDLFAQLDGLWFINKWLEEAQKFEQDNSDSFLEETITALLQAIEKLQIDKEKSVSSGIWVAVQKLFDHSSSKIQEKARALIDSWQQRRCEYENAGGSTNDGNTLDRKTTTESGKLDEVSISEKSSLAAEPTGVDILQPRNSDNCPPERIEELQVNRENEVCLGKSDCGEGLDRSPDPQTSALSDLTRENMSSKEESHISFVQGTASTDNRGSPSPKSANVEGAPVASAENDCPNENNLVDPPVDLPENMSDRGVSSADCTLKSESVSSDAPRGAVINSDNSSVLSTAIGDAKSHASVLNGREDNVGIMNFSDTKVLLTAGQTDTHAASSSPALSDIVHVSGKLDDQKSEFTRMENVVAVKNKDCSRKRSSRKKSTAGSCFSKSSVGISPNASDKRSEMEFDYGIADPLDVARQVAREVEREVADYREPSCSSSSNLSSPGRFSQPDSPGSVRVISEQGAKFPLENEVGGRPSTETSSEDRCLNDTEPDHVTNSDAPVKESSVAVAAQEPVVSPEKGACDFDLNQEVCFEDMHHPLNPVSTSIANASASAPAAAIGTSVVPSQTDGTIRWKGSASTSSFHIASPYKAHNDDGTCSSGAPSSFLKQSQSSLVFDLNVAEGDDKIADQISGKKSPESSGPHTRLSVEKSPAKSERLNLDLNRISEDGDPAPSSSRMEGFYHQSALQSRTPATSSLQPTTMWNIDLNDKPAVQNDFSDQVSSSGSLAQDIFRKPKPGDSISLMGATVEVPRRDSTSQSLPFRNGKALEPQPDANVTRTGGFLSMGPPVAYTHSPVFGYNGMFTGPTMSFSSPVFGSGRIPYLMDTRGSPVVPQFLGPGPIAPPHWPMNINYAPPGLTVPIPGPSQPNFDLNAGFVMDDNDKDSGGLRQFMPVQANLTEEQLQPCSISGVGVKRKEPDSSWGTFPFSYKYQQPPWK